VSFPSRAISGTLPDESPANSPLGGQIAGTLVAGKGRMPLVQNRFMDENVGSLEIDADIPVATSDSNGFFMVRRFVSKPLNGAQTISNTTGLWTLYLAYLGTGTTFITGATCALYVWRPSTGATVGTPTNTFSAPTGITSTKKGFATTFTPTASITAADGDVIICEVAFGYNGNNAGADVQTFYDGINDVASYVGVTPPSAASYLKIPQALSFKPYTNTMAIVRSDRLRREHNRMAAAQRNHW